MKIFLVGGAVRDSLLGIPVKDRDWVVVGATPQQMLNAGYQQVGHDFPVFLHPQSHEEYALARTERKTSFGYNGFACYSSLNITLEQDLKRRDLTINALAQDNKGRIIDICGGLSDLKNRVLRHISPAFTEDPLRILRVARFAACYAHLNFQIANETMILMRNMTLNGELVYLTPERVWKETEIALTTYNPQIYFQILHNCGALETLFPEISALFKIKAPPIKFHPKINIGIYTLKTLNIVSKLSTAVDVRFAVLCHNLDKGLMQKQSWINHYKCAQICTELIKQICQRLHVPKEICDLTKLVARFYALVHFFPKIKSVAIVELFNDIDAWRKPKRVEKIALASKAIFLGCNDSNNSNMLHNNWLYEAWKVVKTVSTQLVIEAGFKKVEISKELTKRRILAIENWKKNFISK